MRERSIVCRGHQVRAIIEGRQTEVRVPVRMPADAYPNHAYPHGHAGRLLCVPVRRQPPLQGGEMVDVFAPYAPGDRLWVKERIDHLGDGCSVYAADFTPTVADAWPWKRDVLPSIHCPRGLARLWLEVESVTVERDEDTWVWVVRFRVLATTTQDYARMREREAA